ncbi:YkgJ family cysteine cluster protein [Aromatoleum evansii]|uniref:YkgJ family cysteine cluster protein n=1 Tax=Aromatoleum evansii TaxID=59406 RepID=UPI00145CC287|nr:YkgJ family cysteine cluster protein [Aromatoleum evansii]
MKTLPAFPCDACGACCRHIRLAEETLHLDRGDGVCRHLDESTNLCSIYDARPDVCRIEEQFRAKYQSLINWNAFVEINVAACTQLKILEA